MGNLWLWHRLFLYAGRGLFADRLPLCRLLYLAYAEHGICPNDLMERNRTRPYESSAAGITASALHDLADLVSDPLRRKV